MRRLLAGLGAIALVGAALTGITLSAPQAASATPLPPAPGLTVQNPQFTLAPGATTVSDPSASDGSAAAMPSTSLDWSIQYRAWDFSALRAGTIYEVKARVKVAYSGTPSGDALAVGVHDMTDGSHLIGHRGVAAAALPGGQWVDVSLGTLVPTRSVNVLSFYVAQTANTSVSQIRVDRLSFTAVEPLVVEDADFDVVGSAVTTGVDEPTAVDGRAASMANGAAGAQIEIPVPASDMIPGASYTTNLYYFLERADFPVSSGNAFTAKVRDVTAGVDLVAATTIGPGSDIVDNAYQFTWPGGIGATVFDPTHDNRVIISRVDNAAVFPAVRFDKATFELAGTSAAPPSVSAHPNRITPGSSAGVNDVTAIRYDAGTAQTVSVVVKNNAGTPVRTLVSAAAQSGAQTVSWDGKNASGAIVPTDVYTAEITVGSTVRKTNVVVHPGLSLTAQPAIDTRTFIPRGVWYMAPEIPSNLADATAYLEMTFGDLQEVGANLVMLANYPMEDRPADVTQEVFDQAQAHGLKVIVNVRNFSTVYGEEVQGDEYAMATRIHEWVDGIKDHPALEGYLLYDEPPTHDLIVDELRTMKRIWETVDPNHVVHVDLNGVEAPNAYHDALKPKIMLSDPYAIQVGHGPGDYTSINGYPDIHYENWLDYLAAKPRRDAASAAPFWTILQNFEDEVTSIRKPSPAEVEATTFEALGRGSKGFIYFMYQAAVRWDGMVDGDYQRTEYWDIAEDLFGQIADLEDTIRDMERIGDVATTTGGGNAAYPSADITSHRDRGNGDLLLTVVNHDVQSAATVTVAVDPDRWIGAISAVTDARTGTTVAWSGSTITLSMQPGEGRVLRVKTTAPAGAVVFEDADFRVFNAAAKGVSDYEASGGTSASSPMSPTSSWDIQVALDPADFGAGDEYDVWAWVKARYTTDLLPPAPYRTFPSYSDAAANVGIFDGVSSQWIAGPGDVTGADLADSRYTLVKIGTVTPADWAAPYIYVAPTASANYDRITVDRIVLQPR